MREPIDIDFRAAYEKLAALPQKPPKGPITSEQEWILWEMWQRVNAKTVAESLHMGYDTAKRHYDRLQAQGGPEGERPEWMA